MRSISALFYNKNVLGGTDAIKHEDAAPLNCLIVHSDYGTSSQAALVKNVNEYN